jgi:predicted aspartyl protease
MRRAAVLGLTLSLLIAALAGAAAAQIYRYTDERGQNTYVDGLQNVPERFRATAVPLGLRNAPAAPAAAAPAGAPGRPSGTAVVKYTPGQPIIVDAKINGGFTAKLLLDTGADRTLVSPRALTAAGVAITKPVASGNITGATGTDRIDFVIVESLEVGDARVSKLPVGSYELAGTAAGDGLLGRDFLDQFNMEIDASKGEVRLAPK